MTQTINIKEWAKAKDKELRETIQFHINQGVDRKEAVEMVLKSSTLGQGYNAQIRYDFLGFQL